MAIVQKISEIQICFHLHSQPINILQIFIKEMSAESLGELLSELCLGKHQPKSK